jgi:hypothetical protein
MRKAFKQYTRIHKATMVSMHSSNFEVKMTTEHPEDNGDPVIRVLEKAAANEGSWIKTMEVFLDRDGYGTSFAPTKAYYLCSQNDVKFRHEGERGVCPRFLCLKDLAKYSETIIVYCSSSGSGKTAELVGSSATRGCDLAIVLTVESDPTQSEYNEFESTACANWSRVESKNTTGSFAKELTSSSSQDECVDDSGKHEMQIQRLINKKALGEVILKKLTNLLEQQSEYLIQMIEAANKVDRPLKLVLAIDEASSCPRIIQGILQFCEFVKDLVWEVITDGLYQGEPSLCPNFKLEVEISIAGTGVSLSTIGSLPDNFIVVPPYHGLYFDCNEVQSQKGSNFCIRSLEVGATRNLWFRDVPEKPSSPCKADAEWPNGIYCSCRVTNSCQDQKP